MGNVYHSPGVEMRGQAVGISSLPPWQGRIPDQSSDLAATLFTYPAILLAQIFIFYICLLVHFLEEAANVSCCEVGSKIAYLTQSI